MKKQQKFWDRIAKSYSKQPIADERAYQHKLDTISDYLEPQFNVFEFGAGTGGTALKLAPNVSSILASDISDNMLEIAEQRRSAAGVENVHFKQMDIETEPLGQGVYDAILGMSIIHLLSDRAHVFRNVSEGLKPGGLFFSSTVCMGTSNFFLRFILPIARPFGLLPNVQFIDESQLISELEAAGFAIEHRHRPRPDAAVFLVARKTG